MDKDNLGSEMKEQMNIVIVGHVDHGKSTVIGRLLADTGSLPEGKLEQVKEKCKRESKVFEYAFLLDALKDEQAQGITIDVARCFFNTPKRDYIIIDAPGHIEFLKNMISGAAHAEAALLVIDAKEGIRENSKRHGYMLSLLGIKQVIVLVNKIDLVNYDQKIFEQVKKEYADFLKTVGLTATEFIPISALEGDNVAQASKNMSWFSGHTVLDALDQFTKAVVDDEKSFRMPVQDVYKFTTKGDARRIVAGSIVAGSVATGDQVVFLPSNKRSTIATVESGAQAGLHAGFTLTEQIYVNRGDLMCKADTKLPFVSTRCRANIFWMGKSSLSPDKEYMLKLGTAKVPVRIHEIVKVLDSSTLDIMKKNEIARHEVGECILEFQQSLAFDCAQYIEKTGRFVIVDQYDIAGGGIITAYESDGQAELREQVFSREKTWERGLVSFQERVEHYAQMPTLVFLIGETGVDKKSLAKQLEQHLFDKGRKVYFLGIGNLLRGLDADIEKEKRHEHIRRLGEVAHILLDAGLIVIATASDITAEEGDLLKTVVGRTVVIEMGTAVNEDADMHLPADQDEQNLPKILGLMKFKKILFDY